MLVPLLVLAAQTGGLSDPRRSYAAGEKDAVLMLPPVTVCDSDVKEMLWSADGSALVVRRTVTGATASDYAAAATGKPTDPTASERMRPKLELLVWSAQSHRSHVVASGDAKNFSVAEMRPMSGSDRIVFSTDELSVDANGARHEVVAISMLSASLGTITRIASTDETRPMVGFELSPTRPLGYVYEINASTRAKSVRFFGTDGRLGGNSIPLAPKTHVEFDESGRPMMFTGYDKEGKKVTFHYRKINPVAGTLGEAYDASGPATFDYSLRRDIPQTSPVSGSADGSRAPSILLKLPGGKSGESGVLTTDGTDAQLSPRGDAVAYISQGSAVVRPLARVSRADYEAAMLAARKAIAMNDAKQVALGLIMFANDMDDVYPSQADYDKIDPYLKDSSLRGSFTYTFGGGSLASIESPATTEIGYVSGPGGRAVAYADGHVKWIPDNP